MDNLAKIMESWEAVLNSDAELAERGTSIYSTLEGKSAIQIEIKGYSSYRVDVVGNKFKIQRGRADSALLVWKLSLSLFKDVMLGRHRLIYSLLDPQGVLTFDTPNFTHWNGASIIEMLYLAYEMVQKSKVQAELVEGLEDSQS
jgi:hypothetical protein